MKLGPATVLVPPSGKPEAANEDRVVYLMRGAMGERGGNSLSESSIGEGDAYGVDFTAFLPTRFCHLFSSSVGMGVRVAE
jgi:hypothetical protein